MTERRRAEIEERRGGDDGGDDQLPSRFVMACLRTNQHGDGAMFKALHRDNFIFVKNLQVWLKWSGHHWVEDTMDAAMAAVEDVADAYEIEAANIRKELADIKDKEIAGAKNRQISALETRSNQLRGDNRRQACLKFAHTSEDPMAIDGYELDSNPWLLGCSNGVVELNTGHFRPGRQDDYILNASPHEWRGIDLPCPAWEKAVLDTMGGSEKMAAFLRRLLGMATCGKVVEKIFPVWIGPGGDNGKTTIIEGVSYALGKMAAPVSSELIVAGGKFASSSGIDTATMSLKGLRFAYVSETEDNAKVSASRVKFLTGKDTLKARSPYDKRQTVWEPTHSLFLLSNFKLRADSEDKAFWSRTIYIPFEMRFVQGEPAGENELPADPYLDEALKREASGILAFLVRGYLEWKEGGLQIPTRVAEESKRTRDDLDYYGAFLDECCIPVEDDDGGVASGQLYKIFEKWYIKNIGNFVPKIKSFGSYMTAHMDHRKVNGLKRYFGIDVNWDNVRVYDPDARQDDWA
jgi:putative DNA primase/helicase